MPHPLKEILLAGAFALAFGGQALAGSFWSLTANGGGSTAVGCDVSSVYWKTTICNAKATSNASGGGSGSIGIAIFGTSSTAQESTVVAGGFSDDSSSAVTCSTTATNDAAAICDLSASATEAVPSNPTILKRKLLYSKSKWW